MSVPVIRVIDVETTGMKPPEAQVVEYGSCDLTLDPATDKWIVGQPTSRLHLAASIPADARAIHHISLADIRDCAPFDPEEVPSASVMVWAAHNWEFEASFLAPVVLAPALCTYKAALRVWPDAPSHSNAALRYWLEDQGLLELDAATAMPPHRSGPDAYVTAHVLRALLAVTTAREMIGWTREPRLFPTLTIGKQKGSKWADVDGGFLNWMLNQADMDADLKWNARRELDRRAGDDREAACRPLSAAQ